MADDVKDAPSDKEAYDEKEAQNVFVNGDSLEQNGVHGNTDKENLDTLSTEPTFPRKSSFMSKDGSRRPTRKKTVSFSSMPTERKISTAQDCLAYIQNGSELIKVRSNSRQYHRIFTLNPDMTDIRWQPTSKKLHKARIPVCSIKEVRSGKTTEALKNKEIAGIYPDECAFSIIFGDNFESMDLIANTPDEANIWVTGLTCLISSKSTKAGTCECLTFLALPVKEGYTVILLLALSVQQEDTRLNEVKDALNSQPHLPALINSQLTNTELAVCLSQYVPGNFVSSFALECFSYTSQNKTSQYDISLPTLPKNSA
ncbi:hypothetical protein ACJMK2_019970 [Sinanodonta woodiana]|uniref:PH domain-containing protein n=1 Tax=Sinanodonta woodiana TaxID=1069815 RepID=A0ABD3TYM4_SINWO